MPLFTRVLAPPPAPETAGSADEEEWDNFTKFPLSQANGAANLTQARGRKSLSLFADDGANDASFSMQFENAAACPEHSFVYHGDPLPGGPVVLAKDGALANTGTLANTGDITTTINVTNAVDADPVMSRLSEVLTRDKDGVYMYAANDFLLKATGKQSNVKNALFNARNSTSPEHAELVNALNDPARKFPGPNNGPLTAFITYSETQQLVDFLPIPVRRAAKHYLNRQEARVRAGDPSLHAEVERNAASTGLFQTMARTELQAQGAMPLSQGSQIEAEEMRHKRKLWELELETAQENRKAAQENRMTAENKRKITDLMLSQATQESGFQHKRLQDAESDLQHTTGAQIWVSQIVREVFGAGNNGNINKWVGREAANKFRAVYKRDPPRNAYGGNRYTEKHRGLVREVVDNCKAIFDVSGIPK